MVVVEVVVVETEGREEEKRKKRMVAALAGADSSNHGRSIRTNAWLSRRRRSKSLSTLPAYLLLTTAGLAAAAASASASTPPSYIPTTIFLPPSSDTAYIFSPSPSSPNNSTSTSLLSLNITSLSTSSSVPITLSSSLPVSPDEAFIPLLLPNGTLALFSGTCSTPSSSSLHLFDFDSQTWHPSPGGISIAPSSDYAQTVPYHLSSGLAFSLQLEPSLSAPDLYVYGGQCGDESYSNTMLKLGSGDMKLASVKSSEDARPKTAAAGFTLTELTPASLTNRSGTVTQSSAWLLLGGHTKGGTFVDVGTVGIWGLPGEEWEFVDVKGVGNGRSGHSAVVSEDGGRVVVYGGWVGDDDMEAVGMGVLKVGVGKGGWEWEDVKRSKEEGKNGRYGHGAIRLPGDVMMVYGGWEVNSGKKREVEGGNRLRFLDMGKLKWVDEYKMPTDAKGGSGGSGNNNGGGSGSGSGSSKDGVDDEDDGDRNKIIGLSVGLGVGLFVLSLAAVGFCLVRRRRARRRAAREETLRHLTLGMNGSLPRSLGGDDMMERDDGMDFMFPWNAATARQWYTSGGDDPYSQGQQSLGFESLRGGVRKTGATVYMPPPPSPSSGSMTSSIGGRPRNARGLYTPTNVNTYDFGPLGQSSRNIDPIFEEEDEDVDVANKENYHPISPDKEECDDNPFLTPTASIGAAMPGGLLPRPGLSVNQHQQDPEVQNWKSEIDAADAVLSARIKRHGSTTTTPPRLMIPPTRTKSVKLAVVDPSQNNNSSSSSSDRTNSNLSEKSAFSFVPGADSQQQQQRLGTAGSSEEGSSSAKTFNTAKSSFPVLQSEGPSLLLYDNVAQVGREKEEEDADYVYVPGSPSKSPTRRQQQLAQNGAGGLRKSWFGSLRRVFSGGTSESSSSSSLNREEEDSKGSGGDYQQLAAGGLGALGLGGGLLLQRRKQGKEAWAVGRGGGDDGDDDWDVERAVEQRLVQIMFTVPKERLRVVNGEVESVLEEAMSGVLVDPDDESGDESGKGDEKGNSGTTSRRIDDDYRGRDDDQGRLRVPSDRGKQKRPLSMVSMAGSSIKSVSLEPPSMDETVRGGGISPSPSLRTMSIRTGTLHTAEAVKLERPLRKSKVLAMVESIESKSSRDS
ncbi:hypothetical protein QBC43DRAFT_355236, partial [Cladorrhinum sp. PSN259]